MSKVLALALGVGLLPAVMAPTATAAPVGQGFNLNASDLRFILKQIKISERHAFTATATDPCSTLLGSGADQIPAIGAGPELPWGLRTVDGTCNNLVSGKSGFGSADKRFPRLVGKAFGPAEGATPYTSTTGTVTDTQPRVISNLVVDQTAGNPAAVDAAGESPETTPSGAFFIPNVAPDVGLSAPYNSWFTLFGQFFDHGLDLVSKGGNGSVFMPLKTDDPLFSTTPGAPNFMVLTRATHGGDHEALNSTSPFVDQSQTYSSHPSHQVFLREYADDANGDPQSTGGLLVGPGVGMADWAAVKAQAATLLGIQLVDTDVLNVPLLATDQYGRFLRGPNGYPQLVVPSAPGGLLEGDPAAPVSTAGATRTNHAFLDDISHNAVPKTGSVEDPDAVVTPGLVVCEQPGFPAGCVNQYDDEMLDAHFMAGDGRVNENIGLTAVHHVFHSEHNRLADEIDVFVSGTGAARTGAVLTAAEEADWKATTRYSGWDYGERLFQAARFVTEMEYQHLAFEEFIRKVQPMVAPFGEGGTGYTTAIDPAIRAEFAHAVYRFGHSMLTESVDRVRLNGTRDDIPLMNAFLNPPTFMAGGLNANQAAGNIVRGMTRQIGNELDEFVTDALRNQLLGLPLDLAALNLARARETGVPGLNAARRAFYAASNNSALTPYESWADFSFSLKHPKSLNNFVAAYGTHPTITAATTTQGKRAAADALVYGPAGPDGVLGDRDTTPENEAADDIPTAPEDRYAFLNGVQHETLDPDGVPVPGHSRWVSGANGVTTTGVDRIDLWVGGLAEKQMVFGGLLGPTFNYVFEAQAEDLQFGDRFYYLSRTAGLNMLTQLEGNSFSELIQRNTDVSGLPADSFSRPDLVFNLAAIGTTGAIQDDPETSYNEATMLTRMANGTVRYGGASHVVFNGTEGNNRVWSSEGDDTIRGDDGDDWMQGGDGNDNHVGGLGDDILLDTNGDDTLKGGDGNDVLSSGQGFGGDLNQGGRGNDVIVHGDLAEAFAGPGDDWVIGGPEDDTVFGDDGDDWIENGAAVAGTGGGAFNLLQGDNGAPFQDDPNEPGHDVLIGFGGESDYDAEGGDDVMFIGPGIQRSEGMLGFDYATHKLDGQPADSDMDFSVLLPPSVDTNRDRFDNLEVLSGWNLDDTLRGDDRDAAAMVDHELTPAGLARVSGLAGLLPAGATGFTGGNMLLGGAGADTLEGRGGDDLIDGDAALDVRISVRDRANPATELESVASMAGVQGRLLAGTINPGQLQTVREIVTPANGTSVDTAVFSGPRADYDLSTVGNGLRVTHARGTGIDGADTVRNVERLRFSDVTIDAAVAVPTAPVAPPAPTAVAGDGQATVTFAAPADGGSAITGFTVRVVDAAGTQVGALRTAPAGSTSLVVTGLTNGTAYRFEVRATNAVGTGPFSPLSAAVTPTVVVTVPGAPGGPTVTTGNAQATLSWTAPANAATSNITGYRIRRYQGATTTLQATTTVAANLTSTTLTGLTNGQPYSFDVTAVSGTTFGAVSARSAVVTPQAAATVPAAPAIGTATAGNAQATVAWTAPATGGSAITGYTVRAFTAAGTQVGADRPAAAGATSLVVTGLTNGTAYTFRVLASNAVGSSAPSAASNAVTPTAPATGGTRTVTLDASADTWVQQGLPTTTGGTATGMTVDSQVTTGNAATRSSAYLRFTVPTLAAGETITAANLSVNVTNVTPDGPAIWRTNPTWTEGTMTWNFGQPARVGTVAVGNFGTMPALGRISTPVAGVTAAGAVSFQLFADSTDGVQLTSRETTTRPQLVLTIATGGTTPAPTAPAAPAAPTAVAGNGQATVSWAAPSTGGSAITGYAVRVVNATTGATVGADRSAGTATSLVVTGLTNGTGYRFQVLATNAVGTSAPSAASPTVTPAAAAADTTAPRINSKAPALNATGVLRNQSVIVNFSERMLGATTATMAIRPANAPLSSPIVGTVTENPSTPNQWVINPTLSLAANTRYTVTLQAGPTALRDPAGNALVGTTANPLVWSFTTGAS